MSKSSKGLFGLSNQAKEQLIQNMLNKRSKRTAAEKTDVSELLRPRRAGANATVPDAFFRFDQHPGYQQLRVHKAAADRLGIESPFFKVHEQVARNTTVIDGHEYINFASYNYLDLCGHPAVSEAAKAAIDRWGTSASASRPVSGERSIQRDLERELALLHDVDDAVVFVSGHATNVSTIGYLFGSKDLILHDALIHNSIVQGIQLSGAHRRSFPHNDWQALERILGEIRGSFERVLIVVEGLYSMDGDYPELDRFIEVKRRHKAFLMVDEAHSIGVLGEHGFGIREQFGLSGRDVDIWMGTLSKALASCGGYIAGESALVEHLKFAAPGFLYSVGIAPSAAAAALAALRQMKQKPERVGRLHERGRLFLELAREKKVNTGTSAGYSVIPAITGSSIKAGRLANALFGRGINVQPIIYPAVEEGAARLRFFISCAHTEEQIRLTVAALAEELARL
jgi:8-amino-7-oxononanoate synthase